MIRTAYLTIIGLLTTLFLGCSYEISTSNAPNYLPKEYVQLQHPDWCKNASIYQINIRQYTKEGSFKAFETHLPRLQNLGVNILWLMPIHPIGIEGRKGSLGSPYAVKDYYGINKEFGDLKSFKHLVDTAHAMGFRVIIDWVANHSAKDNELVKSHPNWYIKSRNNKFVSTPWRDYDDIIDFDYSNTALRAYMTNAMKYWVNETNIDGFRCDVASFVPIDFWENLHKELTQIKPVFMLAEAADRDLHKNAFSATYSWALWDALHNITMGKTSIEALTGGYIAEHVSIWPKNAIRMNFVENHDKNAWEGTTYKNFGEGLQAAIVLTATIDGMPMLYSGQEAGLNKTLPFFEKDTIAWKKDTIGKIYAKLLHLKHINTALYNGHWGGEMIRINNNTQQQVISFVRQNNNDKVVTIVNLSNKAVTTILNTTFDNGNYVELFSNKPYVVLDSLTLSLKPWDYKVLVKK